MKRLLVGSLIWLYEPPTPPVEGLVIGYEKDLVRLSVHRRINPTPLVSSRSIFARIEGWRSLVDTIRQDIHALTQASDQLEYDFRPLAREEKACSS